MKEARGLGSAKDGVHHWLVQRLTAIALIPLFVWFIVSLVSMIGADFATVQQWISNPLVTVLLLVFLVSLFYHSELGVQVVIEDYVSSKGSRLAALILSRFVHFFLAAAAIVAVLRVAFGA
ncbi:succinate dehydrogenase / fumarate reductase membrane anchor subunit [Natronospira proteinivora]|uniref:Succinate dehydrogenase hydrophobic membrane anchor subunit n=1 Tax=Natronospira proteinivora TaxID=1807133 RepID=A0ABT1G5T6_9GAMM|nr:succinate dehydrogenase, hydrophobic membrane anchor protein [Natronospira proteinivora]MCP1726662.1 succinate dehydrogenase / fumarate reductase membrane anchor subunit [Natronospira proteinivora]